MTRAHHGMLTMAAVVGGALCAFAMALAGRAGSPSAPPAGALANATASEPPPGPFLAPTDVRPVAAAFDGPPLPLPSRGQQKPISGPVLTPPSQPAPSFELDLPGAAPAHNQNGLAGGDDDGAAAAVDSMRLDAAFPPLQNDSPLQNEPAADIEGGGPWDGPVQRLPAIEDDLRSANLSSIPPEASDARNGADAPGASTAIDHAMAAVSQQAEERTAAGFRLAAKGALFAARSEMIRALRLIAQALDARSGARRHSDALAAGLKALREASDFAPSGAKLESDLDLKAIIASHRTTVLSGDEENLTAMEARRAYYTFAQQQLALAAPGSPAASNALYGLGRIHQAIALADSQQANVNEPAAMVFHQASLLVEPRNYLAANELGVLLARAGQLEDARRLLLVSLKLRPQATTWRNLAAVERMRGDVDLSRRAEYEASRIAAAKPTQAGGVQWVDAREFATPRGAPESLASPGGRQEATFR